MVATPIIANQNTDQLKNASLLHAIGASFFIDAFEGRRDAYFLDLEQGTPAVSALAFRLTNGANDTVNYFLGEPLAETPTVDDIIANPTQHFLRFAIGTNIDTNRAIAERPDQEAQIRAGIQRRSEQGAAYAQVIAAAVNADKATRNAFDDFLRNARDNAVGMVEAEAQRAVTVSDNFFERMINGFAEFVQEGLFARPRRSGDGKRVSKEVHEFNYLSQTVIRSYGDELFGDVRENGWTHLDVALWLLRLNFQRAREQQLPGLRIGGDAEVDGIETFIDGEFFEIPDEMFDPANFSYGNFIDSYHMRKLLAELKKLVQGTRADNVTDLLRRQGQTRNEFLNNTLHRLAPNGFISLAANEFLINAAGNPPRPVRDYIASTEAVQAFLPGNEPEGVPQGTLLQFSAPAPAPTPTPNLTDVNESAN